MHKIKITEVKQYRNCFFNSTDLNAKGIIAHNTDIDIGKASYLYDIFSNKNGLEIATIEMMAATYPSNSVRNAFAEK
ncbi:hypothetical protein ABF80_11615 [Enterobacter hormaechei subsp. steigerwaltii]|nr:hypothetical protein ABF80_11615 [Enterobacter hormaechei subsp. steigerwaltii]